MDVNQPKTETCELALFDEEQNLVRFHQSSTWQRLQ